MTASSDLWVCPNCSMIDIKQGHVCVDTQALLLANSSLLNQVLVKIR